MKNIKPLTWTAAIAFCLACAPSLAAQPESTLKTTLRSSTPTMIGDASQDMVVTVRKVYFFASLDRNNNGLLSRAELPKDMVDLRRNFLRADYDHNGQLSPMEYILYSRGLAPQYAGVSHAYIYVFGQPTQHSQIIRTRM